MHPPFGAMTPCDGQYKYKLSAGNLEMVDTVALDLIVIITRPENRIALVSLAAGRQLPAVYCSAASGRGVRSEAEAIS
jgi:hypothetical protein